jgi:hypothetical protein
MIVEVGNRRRYNDTLDIIEDMNYLKMTTFAVG